MDSSMTIGFEVDANVILSGGLFKILDSSVGTTRLEFLKEAYTISVNKLKVLHYKQHAIDNTYIISVESRGRSISVSSMDYTILESVLLEFGDLVEMAMKKNNKEGSNLVPIHNLNLLVFVGVVVDETVGISIKAGSATERRSSGVKAGRKTATNLDKIGATLKVNYIRFIQ